MQLAKKQGIAEKNYKQNPSEDNKQIFEKAKQEHEKYREFCLKADEMIVEGLIY